MRDGKRFDLPVVNHNRDLFDIVSIHIYKIIHLTGVLMVFISLGGLIVRSQLGEESEKWKKLAGVTNGVGLILVLLGGLGLLVKLGLGFPGWALAKFVIWLVFGGMIAVVNRKPEAGRALWWTVILLGVLAAYLGGVKPF